MPNRAASPKSRQAEREPAPTAVKASKAPSISRALAALHLLGQSPTPLGVQAIARQLGVVTSSCYYLLQALVDEEMVAFDPDTKRYSLGPGVLTLAQYWSRQNRFGDLAQPHLDEISEKFDVTVVATQIFALDHVTIIAISRSHGAFRFSAHIGTRFPALTSATGRCIAAFGGYGEAEIRAAFRQIKPDRPVDYAAWRAQVEQTRERGYAVDEGNHIAGMISVAAPVWDAQGQVSHAVNAIGRASALDRAGLADLEDAVLTAARQLSHRS
jgi:DNA-binding IclR family transcriptional regulator